MNDSSRITSTSGNTMSLYMLIKPDADKMALSIFLCCVYWLTYAVSGWTADYVHARAFPHLANPLPYSISLPAGMLDLFRSYWQEVDRSMLHILPVKLGMSYVCSYLAACFLIPIVTPADQTKQE